MDNEEKVSGEKRAEDFDALFEAEKAVAEALKTLNDRMKHVVTTYGRGPWRYQGRVFSIGRRADDYFFKGIAEQKIEEIA